MNIGKLRHRIEIQAPAPTRDYLGGREPNWSTTTTVWAAIEPKSAGESVDGKEVASVVKHQLTIRYLPELTTRHRIKWGSRTFAIDSIINQDEANRMMVITATESR